MSFLGDLYLFPRMKIQVRCCHFQGHVGESSDFGDDSIPLFPESFSDNSVDAGTCVWLLKDNTVEAAVR
jgi:hypothetical protein